MNDDKLNEVFKNLDFDVFEPSQDHESEFLKRLNETSENKTNEDEETDSSFKIVNLWKPFMLVAACLAIGVFVFGNFLGPQNSEKELASVSKEMATTQNFYSTLINSELDKLQEQQTPETKTLIDDTMTQLNMLEADYKKLKLDLAESGQDKRVIYAMVSNFQQRIALLQTVLETIDNIKELKTKNNESNIL